MSRRAVVRTPRRRRWPWLVAVLAVVGIVTVVALWLVVRAQQAADALASARDGVSQIRSLLQDGQAEQAGELLPVVHADTARAV
ncbi:MAG TPA: hypothetical protein VMT27_06295, partial [Actinomycetes bacterium]|nr:hypothetical protein [Actinomycetes bacterium]